MVNKLLSFALILILTSLVYFHSKIVVISAAKNDAAVDFRKSTVYIGFERFERGSLWLRLPNNSRRGIGIRNRKFL